MPSGDAGPGAGDAAGGAPGAPRRGRGRGAHGAWPRHAAAVACWLAAWQLLSMAIGHDLLLPGPVAVARRALELAADPASWSRVGFSFARIAGGFLLAFCLALALGLCAGRWRWVRELLEPAVLLLKSVPIVCVVVLLLLWVGARQVSVVAVFLAVFPPVYLSVVEALRARDDGLGRVLRAMGVPAWRRLLADAWQQLLPYLVATSRNACGMAWKAGVAAELIGSPRGSMGEGIYQAKLLLETGDLFAWTLAVVALSWACERVFVRCLAATGPAALELAARRRRGCGASAGAAAEAGAPADSEPAVPASAALAPDGAAPISLLGATLGHGPSSVVAKDLTLELAAGSRTVLADPSGAGKTTLVETVAHMVAPLAGEVRSPARVSVVTQAPALVEGMTAEQNVELAADGALGERQAHDLLARVLPEDALGRPVRGLSGGQRRRVEIVRALAHPSQAVLLDEPLAALDRASRRQVAALAEDLLAGRTLLVASHDPGDADLLCATRMEALGAAGGGTGRA